VVEAGEPLSAPRAAVLGQPIAHSLSPVLHNAAYRALGLRWEYSAIDCGVAELAGVLDQRADWVGFSLTMPLKRAGLELATDVSPRARVVGAANTLLAGPGGWRADNTDVDGVLGAVSELARRPASVTVLGAGGTAQAVVSAVAELGLDECSVLVRDRSRTLDLQATADRAGVRLLIGDLDSDAAALAADLVVSTLPAGAADPLATARWTATQSLLDAVYAPWPTALAAAAQARGTAVLSGALMLLHQAMAQVELMTGRPAPAAAMRDALRTVAPSAGL
jgi:shikimate dehydrogenase